MTDGRYVNVINEEPDATRKGLRARIDGVLFDADGNVLNLRIRYSGWRCKGVTWLRVTGEAIADLPEE
jgi:hypothetical protein